MTSQSKTRSDVHLSPSKLGQAGLAQKTSQECPLIMSSLVTDVTKTVENRENNGIIVLQSSSSTVYTNWCKNYS